VRGEIGITASVGVSANKLVSKVASDAAKPDGLLVVRIGEEAAFLAPRPIRDLPMVGPKTAEALAAIGVKTIGDLQSLPLHALEARFGPHGADLHARARGMFDGPVHAGRGEAKSVSRETTFDTDEPDRDRLRAVLRGQAERVAADLARHERSARTITLKLRWADFVTISRSRTVAPTNDDARVYSCVADLLETALDRPLAVRLVGVALSNLEEQSPQLGLPFRGHLPVGPALDAVRERFGYDAIRVGAAPVPAEKDRHASDDWHA